MSKWQIVMIIVLCFLTGWPVDAQSDEALARIDQAMQHLGEYLGIPVTRDTNQWSWTEKIFPDSSLDCPIEGVAYTPQQVRGYQVRITVNSVEYDYRLTASGDVVILCIGGQPDRASVGIEFPSSTIPQDDVIDFQVVSLSSAEWWAWIYEVETDSLYLINESGQQARLPRPRLPDERPGTTPKLAFSRDGRFLIVAVPLNSGVNGLGFYEVESGQFTQIHQMGAGEDIYLGFGYDNAAINGSTYAVDPTNRLVAIGLASMDFSNPNWRVIIFDLVTGDALYQLDNRSSLVSAYTTNNIVFPRVVYFDIDVVHTQLIRFGADADVQYPALAWHPNANFVEDSPFTYTNIDVLPGAQSMVYAYRTDAAGGVLAPNNALGTVGSVGPQPLVTDATNGLSSPRWAAGGTVVLFQTGNQVWNGVVVQTGGRFVFDPVVQGTYGTPQGYLTRNERDEVVSHRIAASDSSQLVWQAAEDTNIYITWASVPGVAFAPTQIYIPLNLTGIVHCPGTPASIVALGMRAQVETSGGAGLRLRSVAGGELLTTMPVGTEFRIIGGPQCQGGYTWWNLRLEDGTMGWAAEGDQEGYFMEPVEVR